MALVGILLAPAAFVGRPSFATSITPSRFMRPARMDLTDAAADVGQVLTEPSSAASLSPLPSAGAALNALDTAVSTAVPEDASPVGVVADALDALGLLGSAGSFFDSSLGFISSDMRVIVGTAVLLPIGTFTLLLVWDSVKALVGLVTGKERPAPPAPIAPPPEGGLAEPVESSFDEELSVWPALLSIQQSLAALPAEEQRRIKLEQGTNWEPRTTTERPFDVEREGFMFFQGPTPRTSTQPDLPPLLSKATLEGAVVPKQLPILGGVFAASSLAVLATLVLS